MFVKPRGRKENDMDREAIAKEIKNLEKEGRACKNSFRMMCIAQEIIRLRNKLEELA